MQQFEECNDALRVRAPAKINLSLLIAGKRPDGFHEIRTVMSKIDWMDELVFEPAEKEGIHLQCDGPCWAPDGEENLVYRACQMLYEHTGNQPRVKVTLIKNIPAGTGLGSASSDGAAALIGLNRFCNLNVSPDALADMAAALGSDVAFFLDGPLAFCTGRGEKIHKIDALFEFAALLILPDVTISTKKVYENYCHDPQYFEAKNDEINTFLRKKRVDSLGKICANMLEPTCFELYEELVGIKAGIESLGIKPICLSGSGSAMFHILDSPNGGRGIQYQHRIREKCHCKSIIVTNNEW